MFCSNCGKYIPENTSICPECGMNIAGAAQQSAPVPPQVYAENIPVAPAVPEVQLSQPIPMDNVYQQAPTEQITDPNGYPYQQNVDPNAEYQYQQNNGYTYQQNTGYQYQQGAPIPQGSYYDGLNAATPEQQNWNAGQPGQPGSSGSSGGALALGILSICIGFLGGFAFGVIGATIGIALGITGLILSINYRKNNPGGATGGLVTSIIGLSLAFIMLIGCAACGASSSKYLCYGCIGGGCGAAKDVKSSSWYFR